MNWKKIILPLSIMSAVLPAQDFKINGKIPESGFSITDGSWVYERNVDIAKEGFPEEFLISAKAIKQHPKHRYMRGYNGNIVLRISAPGRITALEFGAEITNYADSRKRSVSASYSLNGIDYVTLGSKDFGGGTAKLSGKAELPENSGRMFVKLARNLEKNDRNGRYGLLLFQKIRIKLTGEVRKEEKASEREQSTLLKTVFPTGVFWAWELTGSNAELAKMEIWAFAEENMKTLRDNGYNTCWFVNFPMKEETQLKMLNLAAKYGMKVLFNTDLVSCFYDGISNLENIDLAAERTAARLSSHEALLGYILKDEPLMFDLETCSYFYERMKLADPRHDSVAVVMNRQSLSYLRDSKLPVICSDLYYFGGDKSTQIPSPRPVSQREITNALKSFGNAAELYGKHTWFMGQMFGDTWGRQWFNGRKVVVYPGSYLHWRMPTEAESRWQVWEALRLGTKGVFFYVFHPPVPLTVPPEKASTPQDKKKVAKMDRKAKWAASWKNQKLTGKIQEIDPGEGMLMAGGKPTPQMLATAPVMKLIRANEALLVNRRKADFPVFFPGDTETDTATFVSGKRWIGIVVNRNVEQKRTVSVMLPLNVTAVTDLGRGKSLAIEDAGDSFRKTALTLDAGSGVLLEAKFKGLPGMRFCFESFDQQKAHRVNVNRNAEIFHHGNFCADENRSLRLKKDADPSLPACALLALSNPKKKNLTYSKGLSRSKNGITYCLVRGRLKNASVKAAGAARQGEQSNFMHLANIKTADLKGSSGTIIQDKDFQLPAAVPHDTTALEFYLGKGDYIEDITVWFIPR
ncbi:MAG: hypothetical protein E7055_10895 [Lentisphaerae bacterium]|nr:hypothetical protein [Lentisphaerota bacterium]